MNLILRSKKKFILFCIDTLSLQNITHDLINESYKKESSIDINDLQQRIDSMQQQLIHYQQSDECPIQ